MSAINVPDSIVGYKYDTVRTASGNIQYTDIDLVACNPTVASINLTLNQSASANMKSGRVFTITNESSLFSVTLLSQDGDLLYILFPKTAIIIKSTQDNPTTISHWKLVRPDNKVFESDQYLDVNFFTRTEALGGIGNDTTLSIWKAPSVDGNWIDIGGAGLDLTRTGVLTAASDHLDRTRALVFDGVNDYLTHTAAGFTGTGDLSLMFRMKRPAGGWATIATAEGVITNSDAAIAGAATNGSWILQLTTSETLVFSVRNGGAWIDYATMDVSSLDDSIYHTFILVWDDTNNYCYIYGDGLCLSKVPTAISFAGEINKFQIGGTNGANDLIANNVSISEIVAHVGYAWSSEQCKKIFGIGSKLDITIKSNGNLNITSPIENTPFNWLPSYFGALTIMTTNWAKFWVEGDLVHITISASGTNTVAVSYIEFTPPIVPLSTTFAGSSFNGTVGANDQSWTTQLSFPRIITLRSANLPGSGSVAFVGELTYAWK